MTRAKVTVALTFIQGLKLEKVVDGWMDGYVWEDVKA
jgi:hypothetical protein